MTFCAFSSAIALPTVSVLVAAAPVFPMASTTLFSFVSVSPNCGTVRVWPNSVKGLPLNVREVAVISEKIAPALEALLTLTALEGGATLKNAVSPDPGTVCGVQLAAVFQSWLPTVFVHVTVPADAFE